MFVQLNDVKVINKEQITKETVEKVKLELENSHNLHDNFLRFILDDRFIFDSTDESGRRVIVEAVYN